MNFILYVVDCLRADHLSCYGYPRPVTPHMDALAAEGILFERAFSPSTWTRPVAASLLTGLYPPAHGFRTRTDVMKRDLRTVPELLGKQGYATLAVSAIGNVSSSLGLGKGFDRFIDLYKEPALRKKRLQADVSHEKLYHEKSGEVIFPLAQDINEVLFPWIDKHVDQPFFVFLWAMDPHDPYSPPAGWNRYADPDYRGPMDGSRERAKGARKPKDLQHLIDLYDGEVAYTDHCFGQLLAQLRRREIYDQTAVFLLADHGEAFGDHGHMLHGHLPFREIARVPLLMKLAGSASINQRVQGVVSLVDIVPTVLELADVPRGEWEPLVQGISLMDLLHNPPGANRMVFSETQAAESNHAVYAVRTRDRNYMWVKPVESSSRFRSLVQILTNLATLRDVVRNPLFYLRRQVGVVRDHLYDLAADPTESENLADRREEEVRLYREAIAEWLDQCRQVRDRHTLLTRQPEIDEATWDHLRALGYVE